MKNIILKQKKGKKNVVEEEVEQIIEQNPIE